MQKLIPIFAFLLAFSACKSDPKTQTPTEVSQNKPKEIHIDALPVVSLADAKDWKITSGTLFWQGSKPANDSRHYGTVNISGGTLKIGEGQLLDGTVTIDLNTISAVGMDESQGKTKLEGHLKSADFFDVAHFPTAIFKILEVFPSQLPEFNRVVRGDLTIKNKTKTLNIPIKWNVSGNTATAEAATFFIDRTDWDIKFQSGVIGTLKDKLIDDRVPVSFKLEAKL